MRPKPDTTDKLFTEIILAAEPKVQKLWTEGGRILSENTNCKEELVLNKKVRSSYYNCQPHLWQCFWQGGVEGRKPEVKIELFGQTYHVKARPVFNPILAFSEYARYYEAIKLSGSGLNLHYGYQVELAVEEIPGLSQRVLLTDSCRDTYLPERIYGYSKRPSSGEGFIWDNFGRRIFVDKFYVTNQMINEWKVLIGHEKEIETDRSVWAYPAKISLKEQKEYCAFYGKRLMRAEIFDAASMTPTDFNDPKPEKVVRAQTPWQRDLSKSYLGMARINPDYQLTPLDCQLAQVGGCPEKYFSTDSATWMGMNYPLGFFSESLENSIDPEKNLKRSSRFLAPASTWHELGLRDLWDGKNSDSSSVAFRCYEEVEP